MWCGKDTGDQLNPSDCQITKILSKNCSKMTFRSNSIRILIFASTIFLFGALGCIWFLTRGSFEVHLSSEQNFDRMHFKVQCNPDLKTNTMSPSSCVAANDEESSVDQQKENARTTRASNVLLSLLQPSSGISSGGPRKDFEDAANFAEVIGSMLLNGLPVVGLDDWFSLSDFMNANIQPEMRSRLMQYTAIKGRFVNLLGVRDLELGFTPNNCWTRALIQHLNETTINFHTIKTRVYKSMDHFNREKHRPHNKWAVIELVVPSEHDHESCRQFHHSTVSDDEIDAPETNETDLARRLDVKWEHGRPQLTIRMHPISVPNTRSYIWNPLKDAAFDSLDTGQLMYYTSGFLTLQLEIQNFFSTTSVGGAAIERNIMEETQKRFQSQMSFMDKLMNSSAPGANKTSPFDQFLTSVLSLQHKIYNKNAPVIDTPIFLRALSQPSYLQNKFWQQFGDIMTTCLVVYFCIPAVIVASRLSSEIKNGQIEILSTLPGVRIMHSAIAWCLCVVRILALWFGATLIFFYIVLESSDALIPAVNLLLLGLSLAPIAVTLTILVKQSDSVVVIIPTVVFVLMLPGLLYFDMAFDEQRTITTELLLCLSPPSAAAIVIRQLCSLESLGHGMKWTTLSPVANTPLFSYTYMLLFDIILYTIFMIAVSEIVAYSPIANRSAQAAGPIFEANELYLTGIGKEYGGLTGTVPVLTNICGRARIGTVTTLLGSNGAGKSTLMRIIAGLDGEYDGYIQYPRSIDATLVDEYLAKVTGYIKRSHIERECRMIGWCPQQDALFDYLTVLEHFELFADLLGAALGREYFDTSDFGNDNWRYSSSKRERQFNRILSSLGLVNQSSKAAHALSGGMKRRLSLAMASFGNPTLLLLDEPTSGCDSQTREKVRQWILASRERSAVLVSTHHVDDISIISDRVWYLDDRYMCYDGTVTAVQDMQYDAELNSSHNASTSSPPVMRGTSQLKSHLSTAGNKKTVRFSEFEISWGQKALVFRIGSPEIMELFKEAVKNNSGASLFWGADASGINLFKTAVVWDGNHFESIHVPGHLNTFLFTFVQSLEKCKCSNWSLASPNVFKAVTAAAAENIKRAEESGQRVRRNSVKFASDDQILPSMDDSLLDLKKKPLSICCAIGADFDHIHSIIQLRWTELKSQLKIFSTFNLLTPFLVVVLLGISCGGSGYPKLQLASEYPSLPTIGEVMGGSSVLKHISSGFESNWVSKKSDARSVLANDEEAAMYGSSKKKIKKKEQPLLDDEKHALTETFGNLITWVGNTDSNKMETIMQNSLMDHELDRWGSIVVHDKIQNFFETSVYIPANALLLSPDQLFPFIESAHKRMCDETSRNKINGKNGPDTDNSVENLWKMEKSLLFCGEDASTRIGVAKMYNSTTKQQSKALVITAYASLQSNVTLICNTTTHHAAPIFLKEFVASAYSSIGKVDMKYKEDLSKKGNKYEDNDDTAPTLDDDNRKEIRGREMQFKGSPQYDLFSFPFAELDLMNEGSMWRGYLGASFVLIFMLISTMISVRFISEFRASGVKHLIHLSGVSVSSYWIANYIFDTMVMFSILFAVYCAVYLGGNPIRSFYFDLPPFTGFLFFSVIVAFSFAIVAANYAFCALAADALACQLGCVLLSIIFGVCVKLYIQLHKSSNFSQLSTVLTIVSPSYAFTSALFDMFGQYASNIGKSSGILTELNCPGLLAAVFFDVMAMFGQAVGYLFITMMIDRYWVLIKVFWGNALPSLYRMIRSINKLFGHAWNGVRSASVMSLTSMEADFSLQSLWPGFNGNSTAANQGASGAIYESELTASAIGEMAPLIAQLGLPRNYSDPDLFDEEKGDYGSIWDISKSELKLSHSTSLHALHSDDHASYSGDSDKADSAAILDSVIESTPIIVVRDLSMEYPWQHVPAIHNINMTVSSGNRVALVGVNGGGKSTLFRTLSSVNDSLPKNGSATILGYNVVSASWSIGDQQLVGYVPQEGGLFGFMSVREVLDLFKSFSRYVVCPAQSELSVIDEKYLSYPIRALSGGNKKKLSILLSNMHSPRALLLDECTTGIDPHAAERVLDYLSKNVTDQQGLLFASHRVEECVTVCDKIIVMCDGQIALDGPIHKFYEMASEFYLVDIGILNQNQSIPVANSFIDLIIGQLSSRLSTDLAAADLAESLFISTVVYCPTLVRVMCRKTDAPLSTMWTLLEELMIAKRIKNYYFRDVGMEEVLAVLISQSTVALDH